MDQFSGKIDDILRMIWIRLGVGIEEFALTLFNIAKLPVVYAVELPARAATGILQ